MAWYKKAYDIQTFEDRNVVNLQIRRFKKIAEEIRYAGLLVFLNASIAKKTASAMIDNKQLSSFPVLRDFMIEANRIALDNPWKFQELCNIVAEDIDIKAKSLEKEREDFINGKTKDKTTKGWFPKK